MNHLLELLNVTKEFSGGTVALDDVSFSIDADSPSIISIAGETVCHTDSSVRPGTLGFVLGGI